MNKQRILTLTAALASALAASGPALASDAQLSAQSIVVNPVQPALNVQVWTDKDASGRGNPTYNVGENIRIGVQTNQDAYVYLFNLNADGKVDMFMPNRLEGSNFVKANTRRLFPASNANFQLNVSGPSGLDKVFALASKERLNIDALADFASDAQFGNVKVNGQSELAQTLSIVVNPVAAQNWVTDTAFFRVTGGTSPAPVTPTNPTGYGVGERSGGSVDGAMQDAYARSGGANTLGNPTGYARSWGDGWVQHFAGSGTYGKAMLTHANGSSRSYAVHGPILERYLDLAQRENGGVRPPSKLGWAAGDEKVKVANMYGTSGAYGYFQNGALYFGNKYGTYWLGGNLLTKYQGLGGAGSFLGFPTRDAYWQGGGWNADFEGGSIRTVNGVLKVYRR